jgi:hypothetical protein
MLISFWNSWRKALSSSGRSNSSRRFRKRLPQLSRLLALEQLEDRIVPTVGLLSHYTGLDSAGLGGGGEPPDTQGAAGPSSTIETINQGVAIYSPKSSGLAIATDDLADFYFTKGGLPHVPLTNAGDTDIQSDPFTIYDPLVGRFIVEDLDFEVDANGNPVNNGGNALLLAVSKSSNPTTLTTSDWFFYSVNTAETGVALQDYPGNPGYNADALVVTLNSFDASSNDLHTQINAISINALINGSTLTSGTNLFQTDFTGDFLPRPATMPDSAPGGPMWMVAMPIAGGQNPGFTGSTNTIDVIKMSNVLSANPTFTTTTLSVNTYFQAVNPLQPDGTALTADGFIDARIMKAAERNGIVVASQITSDAAGDEDNASWYAINVSSGTPMLAQQGAVSGGPGVYNTYPAIDINAQSDIGMTFQQSGTSPGQFESVFVTGRTPADAPGTMEAPVLVQSGVANYTGTRQGDMTGINVDTDGSFWAFSEWANNEAAPNWGTAVANFSLTPPINIVLTSATEGIPLNNVTVGTFIDTSGAPLGAYTSTINWGDGTITSGQVVPTSTTGVFDIVGSHTYLEEGEYSLTLTENNGIATVGPVTGLVTVADAPLTGFSQALTGQTGGFVNNALVAVFTDTDSSLELPSNYSASIQWFEGNGLSFRSDGTIVNLFSNTFAVYGSTPFSFPSGGLFTVRVVVQDVGGASVTVDSVINVSNNPAIPPLVPQSQTDTGPVNVQFVSLQDALTNLLGAERLFFIAFNFGTSTQQQRALGNLLNAFFAYEAAVSAYDLQLPGA